ncbi:hypothetical protein LMH73_009130 [Vibrio splendidus]|nr:hypothetical protein [Vibrio splendidus]MCC4880313.1 hypothetical protein [Vibrio splendidus]
MLELLKSADKPQKLDSIDLVIDGVELHVYGILHGVFGGANKEYIEAVNLTIKESKGVRYCENAMMSLYDGLDVDVHDWLALKTKEMFKFTFYALLNPRFWYGMVKTIISEKLGRPRFGEEGIHTIPDSVSSTHFHLMPPQERREICGFPNAEEYLMLNIKRQETGYKKSFRFADQNWKWLEIVEPYASIPLRSMHMLEYAIHHAKKNGHMEISLFVGEIHNTDIEWYASVRGDEDSWVAPYRNQIKKTAIDAQEVPNYMRKKRLAYLLSSGLAGFIAVFPLMLFINALI